MKEAAPWMKVLLVDDEKNALDALRDVLAEFEQIEVAASFTDPLQALDQAQNIPCQAVFLDIDMPGMNGLELAERLLESGLEAQIVFVTAYDQYAVEAFEVNAMDYLLKPIRSERMAKTLERLMAASKPPLPAKKFEEVRIGCFGAFRVRVGSEQGEELKWRTNKTRELFAYLTHHRSGAVHKSRIIEDLWPDLDVERSMVYLHTCIYQIRKTIRQYRLQDWMTVHFTNDCYQLVAKGAYCDSEDFLEAAGNGKQATAESIVNCERAAALYSGDYMAVDDFIWAEPVRQKLQTVYLELMKGMAQYYMEEGLFATAIRHLQQVLQVNPLREDFHEMLLQAYAETGDRFTVVDHYNRLRQILYEELGVEPKFSIQALVQQLSGKFE
jgi:two-component SAPR family response regulator